MFSGSRRLPLSSAGIRVPSIAVGIPINSHLISPRRFLCREINTHRHKKTKEAHVKILSRESGHNPDLLEKVYKQSEWSRDYTEFVKWATTIPIKFTAAVFASLCLKRFF